MIAVNGHDPVAAGVKGQLLARGWLAINTSCTEFVRMQQLDLIGGTRGDSLLLTREHMAVFGDPMLAEAGSAGGKGN